MTAANQERTIGERNWKYKKFTLLSGTKGWKGAAAFQTADGKIVPAQNAAATRFLGVFFRTVDAAAGDTPCELDLIDEMHLLSWLNAAGGDAVQASDAGKYCYFLDDQTVQITPTSRFAGIVRGIADDGRVIVEPLDAPPGDAPLVGASLPAFAANDLVVPATITHGAVYDIPATAGVSTVTLPAGAQDGTSVQFAADGTKNGHTVQYRDATGPANLTTALLASKRHLVVATKLGGKWFANAYVSP